jgi:Ca2+-binding RTX toxin-like protein
LVFDYGILIFRQFFVNALKIALLFRHSSKYLKRIVSFLVCQYEPLFGYVGSLSLVLAVLGTTMIASSNQVWADVIEGTEGPDVLVGTPDDQIDSKGGDDINIGDTVFGDGSGNDVINSGEGIDENFGDTFSGDGSGDDIIASGEGIDENSGDTSDGTGSGDDIIASGEEDDVNTGNGGADIFSCGDGEDTVTDFNEAEGDIAAPDCENINP